MNLPSRNRSAFEGQLQRNLERFGWPVVLKRLRDGREYEWHVTALIGLQQRESLLQWDNWGGENILSANPQWVLFAPDVRPEEGDTVLLGGTTLYRITRVNPADVVQGETQGWLCQIVKEQ